MDGDRNRSACPSLASSGRASTHAPHMRCAEVPAADEALPDLSRDSMGLKFWTTKEMMSRSGQLSDGDTVLGRRRRQSSASRVSADFCSNFGSTLGKRRGCRFFLKSLEEHLRRRLALTMGVWWWADTVGGRNMRSC